MNIAIGKEDQSSKNKDDNPLPPQRSSKNVQKTPLIIMIGGKSGSSWYTVLQDYGDKKKSQIFPTSPLTLDHNKIIMFLISHLEHVSFLTYNWYIHREDQQTLINQKKSSRIEREEIWELS